MNAAYSPTKDEKIALHQALTTLATRGIAPGEHGYDVAILASAVYAHGGAYDIDFFRGSFRAEIRPQQASSRIRPSTEMGWTPAVALAFALARGLAS